MNARAATRCVDGQASVLVDQRDPCGSRETEVGDVLAVKVTDLAAADLEAEFAQFSVVDYDAGPRSDRGGDRLADSTWLVHVHAPLPCRYRNCVDEGTLQVKVHLKSSSFR